ncbi:riboflavin biosynthesis protein RibD [Chromatiales bacterium (ex Bugula neritina AB1)]|nr:riboflavin biosynthesis protein RibD [Chromatiales bacterium (ex Bugula neritina AB1)]
MALAIDLAGNGLYTTEPNPRVGCVLVKDEQIIGKGWHQFAGRPHAEIEALNHCDAEVRGATAYVTLEPCSFHGRTPPCCDALIEAGLARVVVAVADPNPLVAGTGIARLRDAGIEVDVGLMADESIALNCGFFARMIRGRPYVRLKMAASLDGRTALSTGNSSWITSEEARQDVQHWRARAGCILTGVGTVLADDPRMTVRLSPQQLANPGFGNLSGLIMQKPQPVLAVVDSDLRTPRNAKIFDREGSVLIYSNKNKMLNDKSEVVYHLSSSESGMISLDGVLRDLASREVNEVHVEGGAELAASLLREDLIDELIVYIAPNLLGADARALFAFSGIENMADRPGFQFSDVTRIGPDLRLTLTPAR